MQQPIQEQGPRFDLDCPGCGSKLHFQPGDHTLECQHCGHATDIDSQQDSIGEQDFEEVLAQIEEQAQGGAEEVSLSKCRTCGAETTISSNISHTLCAFCGSPVSVEEKQELLIQPQAILPFKITEKEALSRYRKWIHKLWFAPSKLKQMRNHPGAMRGVYLPHWTFDSEVTTTYTGMRGEYYYTTQTYRDSNGKTRTRRVRHTRWWPRSGTVFNSFDDLLTPASRSIPPKILSKLEPWGLDKAVQFDPRFSAGFVTETYTIGLREGFSAARQLMEGPIRSSIRRDIGGDEQRILSSRSNYQNVTFKHLLLPCWLSVYRFKNCSYRISVNACTGEVQGERPWCKIKIAGAIIATITLAAAIYYAIQFYQG